MKLCIFGSRNLKSKTCFETILEEISLLSDIEFISTSGDADGICHLAILAAKKNSIPLHLHFLNRKFAKGKYAIRSKSVLNEIDYVLFFHDGITTGTKNEIKICEKLNIKYKYILYKGNDLNDWDDDFKLSEYELTNYID